MPKANPWTCGYNGEGRTEPRGQCSQRQCSYASFGNGFPVGHDRPVQVETRQPARTWVLRLGGGQRGSQPQPTWRQGMEVGSMSQAEHAEACPLPHVRGWANISTVSNLDRTLEYVRLTATTTDLLGRFA